MVLTASSERYSGGTVATSGGLVITKNVYTQARCE